jgi:hypothetical protein
MLFIVDVMVFNVKAISCRHARYVLHEAALQVDCDGFGWSCGAVLLCQRECRINLLGTPQGSVRSWNTVVAVCDIYLASDMLTRLMQGFEHGGVAFAQLIHMPSLCSM